MADSRSINMHIRVTWKTPTGMTNDADTDLVWETIRSRVEDCLRTNVCGAVGVVPGTAKMEMLYCTVI